MENISIVGARKSELEFDVSIQGIEDDDMQVRFVIHVDKIHYGFLCDRGEGEKWIAKFPALPQIKYADYPFYIEVVADGFYFRAFSGIVTVAAEPVVDSSSLQTGKKPPVVSVGSIKSGEEILIKRPDEEQLTTISSGAEEKEEVDSAAQRIADKLLSKKKDSTPAKKKAVKKKATKKPETKKDKAVKEAIAALKADKDTDTYTKSKEKAVRLAEKLVREKTVEVTVDKTTVVTEDTPHTSALTSIIDDLRKEPELSEQAQKVRDILDSGKY